MDLEDVVSTSRVSIVEDIPKVHKQRKHIRPQSSPHVSTASSKPSTSGLQNNSDTGQNMKSNEDDESKGSQQDDSGGCVNDWVSGGPVGSKGAVLVFRSCVLASKRSVASSPTRSIGQNTGTTILLNKAKNMARRLVAEPHSFNVRPKNIMHDVMHTFGNSKKYTGTRKTTPVVPPGPELIKPFCFPGQAYVVRHVSDTEVPKTESLEEQGHEAKDPSTQERKRGIEDVLSDLSKITLKKNLNVENTTANIKPAQENQTKDIKDDKKIKKPKIKKRKTSGQFRGPGRVLCNVESDDSEQSLLKEVDNVKVLESSNMPANILKVTYKLVNTETKLLHRLLQAHGLTEVPQSSNDFNLLWSGLHLKPDVLRSLSPYQRVNHFPRSYELTRKDKLFKNIEKMQYFRGVKHFNFVPTTFLMPAEYKELLSAHQRTKGPWIVKPAASSRGRGIYIVNTPEQIPKGENVVVAKYIDKPLLINGHKCDLRLYVCVTSIDPLLIYLYEEGLVRFATVKYDKTNKNLWNPCMHLCNYSINKYHTDYIKCDDPRAGNVGHKWTLSALLKHLRGAGRDTSSLMASIEDLVVKALLSSAQTIAAAARVFVPCSSNCFELFGFDILVDETLKPWLLEINLSPSLGCDSPLDARVKSSLLADTLTLVGIPAVGMAKPENSEKTTSLKMRIGACRRVHSAENVFRGKKANDSLGGMLTGEELRLIRSVKAQYARRGGFVRIFPSQNSWQKYSRYLDPVTGIPVCSTSVNNTVPYAAIQHNYNLLVHSHALPHSQNKSSSPEPSSRVSRYESAAVTSSAPPVQIESRPASAAPRPKHKQLIRNRLLEGMTLTAGESRRLFGLYLTHVLKRVSCGASEQAVQHAALLARFLRRAATTLRMPYHVQGPTSKMCDKDRCAVVAKQLNDFLYMYYRETDLCTDSEDAENCVSNIEFAQFLYGASEADLEEILLLVLKQAGWCCVFVGGGRLCVDGAPPGAAAPAGAPPGRHTLLQLLARLCPTNNRRYRAPSNTSQSLDSRRDDDVTSSLRDISDENAIQTLHDKYKSS